MAMSVLKSVDNIDACIGTLVATRAYQAHLDCSVVYFLCGCDHGGRRSTQTGLALMLSGYIKGTRGSLELIVKIGEQKVPVCALIIDKNLWSLNL